MTSSFGCAGVPKPAGSAIGPPEPKSMSSWSSRLLLYGLKKSLAVSVPSPLTCSRITLSARVPGGL
jgi:hypothetical protein